MDAFTCGGKFQRMSKKLHVRALLAPAKGLWKRPLRDAHLDRARRPFVGTAGAENPEAAKGVP